MPWTVASAVSLAVAAIGTGVGVYESIQSQQEQKKANQSAQQAATVQRQQAMAQQLQQTRINSAQVFASASNSGTGNSSGAQGTMGYIGTQGAVNLDFTNNLDTLQQQRLQDVERAGADRAIGSEVEQGSQIGASLFAMNPSTGKSTAQATFGG